MPLGARLGLLLGGVLAWRSLEALVLAQVGLLLGNALGWPLGEPLRRSPEAPQGGSCQLFTGNTSVIQL